MAEKRGESGRDAAEMVAVGALSFLASEPEELGRFLALTGLEPTMLRRAAAEPGFLTGVLDYFLGDERLLVAYATASGMPATAIAAARRMLAGRDEVP